MVKTRELVIGALIGTFFAGVFTFPHWGVILCGSKKSCSNYKATCNQEANYISNYEEKRNLLRKLADTNRDKTLDNSERMKMYKMCGVADKKSGYVLNIKDLEKGIENYLND